MLYFNACTKKMSNDFKIYLFVYLVCWVFLFYRLSDIFETNFDKIKHKNVSRAINSIRNKCTLIREILIFPLLLLHCMLLYYITLHVIILYYVACYHIILHSMLSYYITLHVITLKKMNKELLINFN